METTMQGKTFLLTGATGFLGRRILHRLLGSGAHICVLVRDRAARRGKPAETAFQRTENLLAELGHTMDPARVQVIVGDLQDFDRPAIEAQLRGALTHFASSELLLINIAASLTMDHPGQAADKRERIQSQNHRTNVLGFAQLLDLLSDLDQRPLARRRLRLRHVFHFSTAYAHGGRHGLLPETTLGEAEPHNSYESSKREGEHMLERWANQPGCRRPGVTILRPSIVTGPDTPDGYAAWLDTLLQPVEVEPLGLLAQTVLQLNQTRVPMLELLMRALERLHLPWMPIPGNAEGLIDLIDVDDVDRYAWACICAESVRAKASEPRTLYLHLSNPNADNLLSLARTTLSACGQSESRVDRVRIIKGYLQFDLMLRLVSRMPVIGAPLSGLYQRTAMLRPYLARPSNTRFDTRATSAYFAGLGLRYQPRRIDAHYVQQLIAQRQQPAPARAQPAVVVDIRSTPSAALQRAGLSMARADSRTMMA